MSTSEGFAPTTRPVPLGPHFGRFELLRLLGKSQCSMCWLVRDPRSDREWMLTLPRVQPVGALAQQRWLFDAQQALRLDHPHLATSVELSAQEQWPYLAVDRSARVTLAEWLTAHPNPAPIDVVRLLCQALEGLAFAHEAGVAHRDLQLHSLIVNDARRLQVMGLSTASPVPEKKTATAPQAPASGADLSLLADIDSPQSRRDAAAQDVLACGVLLHRLLTGAAPLDEPDVAKVVRRLSPLGNEFLRLPWSTPHPIDQPLRAIANRATASQPSQRYVNARSFLRALQGWMEAEALGKEGMLDAMFERLQSVGLLPAGVGMAARVERLASMDAQHTEEISHHILQDMALSFALLREVNTARLQEPQGIPSTPVLTVRRAISMLGLNGVRRAANSLRLWPGPLSEPNARALRLLMDRVRLAGHVAQALRPAGYDGEVVFVIAAMQNLGRLLAQYHYPEEFEQIQRLIQAPPAATEADAGSTSKTGWSEAEASYAVLGIDIDTLGAAVVQRWGLGDEMLHMIHRLPRDRPVRTPEADSDVLRLTASAANEIVDAMVIAQTSADKGQASMPSAGTAVVQSAALRAEALRNSPAQRYARTLGLTQRRVQDILAIAREALRTGVPVDAVGQPGLGESGLLNAGSALD